MGKDDGSVGDEAAGRVDNKCKQRHGETGKGPREGPYHVRIIFMLRTVRMWGGQNDPKGTGAGATSSVNAELRFPLSPVSVGKLAYLSLPRVAGF